jgi:hypothetical protein
VKHRWNPRTIPLDYASSVDIFFGKPKGFHPAPHCSSFVPFGFDNHGFEYDLLTLETDSIEKFLDDCFR